MKNFLIGLPIFVGIIFLACQFKDLFMVIGFFIILIALVIWGSIAIGATINDIIKAIRKNNQDPGI